MEIKINNIFDILDSTGKSIAPDSMTHFRIMEMVKKSCEPFSIKVNDTTIK